MKISILHPFTPKAAGVVEKIVPTYHSQPHVKAMEQLSCLDYKCSVEYFTPKFFKYDIKGEKINWVFYPVDYKLNGDHKKWKKQYSKSCLKSYTNDTPDVTIINMSGHSSPFSHELAKIILKNNKRYIAMLGGQHYSPNSGNIEYYQNAHHILVHTHLQKAEMEKMDMFKGKDIRVFPLGVDCNVFKPLPKNELNNKGIKLLYVGRIVEWKRVHLAIETVNELKNNGFENVELKIIGPVSSESYQTELINLTKKYNLEGNIKFLGYKKHHELPKYFQEADLFLLPSDKETFGMVMIESMACETPVAGMDCPGGPLDVITDNVNGILATPETYASKIVEYFKDPVLQEKISRQARVKALNEYSIEATNKVLKTSVEYVLNSIDG